jgi:hypothetical protein
VKWSFLQISGNDILINGVPSLDGLGGPLGSTSDAIQPDVSRQITANNDDPGDEQSPLPNQLEDGNEFTLTFRDATLSPIGGPNVEPGAPGLVNTAVLTIIASDMTVTSSVDMIVQTVNDGTDTVSSGITLDPLDTFDFSTGTLNWTSVVLSGAVTAQNANGLCITVNGASGAQFGQWGSPSFLVDPPIELVNGKAYRARFDLTSNATNPNAEPLVVVGYTSLAWGGNSYWFGVLGDANAFGVPQGLDFADVWITPIPVRIPAWQTGAFQPAEDGFNDAQLEFLLPNSNANIVFSGDAGTICLGSLSISSGDVSSLNGTSVVGPVVPTDAVFDAASLVLSNLAADNNLPKSATFVGAGAQFAVAPISGAAGPGGNQAVALGLLTFGETNGSTLSDTNPIPWNSQMLLDGQATMESVSGGTDPINAIALTFISATAEIGGTMFVTSGAPGGVFDEQGVPTVGEDRVFTGLFFTSNTTLSGGLFGPDDDSLTMQVIGANRNDLAGAASGADPYIVKLVDIQENQVP